MNSFRSLIFSSIISSSQSYKLSRSASKSKSCTTNRFEIRFLRMFSGSAEKVICKMLKVQSFSTIETYKKSIMLKNKYYDIWIMMKLTRFWNVIGIVDDIFVGGRLLKLFVKPIKVEQIKVIIVSLIKVIIVKIIIVLCLKNC